MAETPSEERPYTADEDPLDAPGGVTGSDAGNWLPGDEILALLADRESVIPVIGAGVSMAAGIAGVAGLCDHLKTEFEVHPDLGEFSEPDDLFAVADEIVNHDFRVEAQVQQATARYFIDQLEAWKPVEVTRLLLAVPSRLIINLNYDRSLEETATEMGQTVASWDGLHDVRQFTQLVRRDFAPEHLTIMHLHGTVVDPRTIVLTEATYGRIGSDGEHQRLWESLVRDRRMAFLGTSLNEINVLGALQSAIKKQGRKHPYFATGAEIRRIKRGHRMVPSAARHGVEFVELPSHDHLRGIIRHLGRPDSGNLAASIETPRPPGPDTKYVANVIRRIEGEDGPDGSALLSLGTDRAHVSEEELAGESRALILGVPGSGKSELLRHAIHLAPRGETPILINLADVPFEAAEPSGTRMWRPG